VGSLALLLALVFAGFALVFGVLGYFGIVMLMVGSILVTRGLLRLIHPTGHPSIARLGRTSDERQLTLRDIDNEISSPDAWRVRLVHGGEVILSANWLVHFDESSTMVAHRNDVVWMWEGVKQAFMHSPAPCIYIHTRHTRDAETIEIRPMDGWLFPALNQALPHVLVGFHPEWGRTPRAELAAEVDRRRQMLRGG
jgi:hypothetical protein